MEALGGRIGMLICNDRRWPEAFRVLGLQGVELVLIGYNTPALNGLAFEPPHRRAFHNHLTMQAGAYQNGTWVVGVAKAGREEGVDMLGGSAIVSPNGEIVAQARSVDDEVVVAACDLDDGALPQVEHLRLRGPPAHRALRPDRRDHGPRAAAREGAVSARILVINPNSSSTVTDDIARALKGFHFDAGPSLTA